MSFNKLAVSAFLATAAAASMGQVLTGRVFTYDGSNFTNGSATYILSGDGANANLFAGVNTGGVAGQNNIVGASTTNVGFLASTLVNVATYVYIGGNFGGVYNVEGVGAQQDIVRTNDIEVITNRSLSFTATGFYPMANNVGTITYNLQLLQDYPTNGVPLGQTGQGIDASFNGASVNLNAATSLPPDGRATLRLNRVLSLYQNALGGKTYSAAGIIQVTVN